MARVKICELTGYRNLPDFQEFMGKSERDTDSYAKYLQEKGYNILGGGQWGIVFQPKNRDWVAKIWINDPPYSRAVEIMKAHQSNPHIPRIIFGPKHFDSKHSIVVMEKLKKVNQAENTLSLIHI